MKRKISNCIIISFLFLTGLIFFSEGVSAMEWEQDNPLYQHPDASTIDSNNELVSGELNIIPGDYSTVLNQTANFKYVIVGSKGTKTGYANFDVDDINNSNKPTYVIYKNIAIFNGTYVDLKLDLLRVNKAKSGTIKVYTPKNKSDDFLRVDKTASTTEIDGSLEMKYTFMVSGSYKEQTGDYIPVDYSGMWNYRRVNARKAVALSNFKHVLVYNPETFKWPDYKIMYYKKLDDRTIFYGTKDMAGSDGQFTEFTTLFNTDSKGSFYQEIVYRTKSQAFLEYSKDPVAKMELPTPQIVGEVNENFPKVSYTVVQDMPKQVKPHFYPKLYNLSIQLDKSVKMDSSLKVTVINLEGRDKTSNFNISYDTLNHRILATVSADLLSNEKEFVDNSYRIKIDSEVDFSEGLPDTIEVKDYSYILDKTNDDSEEYEQGETIKGKYFFIPASVKYETESYFSKVKEADAKTRAEISAAPIEQKAPEQSSTDDWSNKTVIDLFTNIKGAFTGDDLVIKEIKRTEFNKVGKTTVPVTLVGTKSKVEKTIDVPVQVLGKRTAKIIYEDKEGNLLKNAVDSEDNPIETVLKSGYEGQAYDYNGYKKTIKNYRFVKSEGDKLSGNYPVDNKELVIKLVYEVDDQEVSVSYLDENKNKISVDAKDRLAAGKDHTIESANIPGYKVKSVKVDNKESDLSKDGKTTISVKDKGIDVVFTYESVHYSLDMKVNKSTISQRDDITYTLNVKSGMVYPTGVEADDYSNVAITIPIDERLENIDKIEVLSKNDTKIGIGQYDDVSKALKVTLSEKVKNTEDFKVTYVATVKPKAKTNDDIKAEATMSASYLVNGAERDIKKTSNEVKTTIMGGLRFLSTPDEIDFGSVEFKAKNATIGVQKIDKQLVVSDTRSNAAGGWTMTAEVVSPIQTTSGKKLDGQITYRKGNEEFTLTSDAKAIYKHQTTATDPEVNVSSSWGQTLQSDGVKLKFKSTDMLQVGEYKGKIQWKLIAGQP